MPARALLASSGLCAALALIVRGAIPWLRARRARRERALSDAADQVERANQARILARENEERVRLLLDSTAEAICGLDLSGIVTFCNHTALRILGLAEPEQLLGRSFYAMARRGASPVINAISAMVTVAFGVLILLSERLREA